MNIKKTNLSAFLSLLFFVLISVLQAQNIDGILEEAHIKINELPPVPKKVNEVEKPVLSLNGTWNFKILERQQVSGTIDVPGEWVMQGFDVEIGETAVYSRKIEVPADWNGKRVFVKFDAVSSYAEVFVNGNKIGGHEGGFVPFVFDITAVLRSGSNEIEVRVKANTISDVLACTSQYAAHTVGGLLRKVNLFVLPDDYISDITLNTNFDSKYQNADLIIDTALRMAEGNSSVKEYILKYSLFNAEDKLIKTQSFSVDPSNTRDGFIKADHQLKVKMPKKWNPESPYLYTLKTELIKGGTSMQTLHQKIGFREIEIVDSKVLVNGKPVKLHGVNRHSVHPLTGRSISPALDRLDAKLFKEANCNYIRTSHYPPSEEFLRAADSIGLFVESEAALTWIQHHASPIWGYWNYKDEKFLPYMLRANIENIQANKNHSSILIWSIANESKWSPLWEKVQKVISEMDPGRPNSFHDQCWGGFNNAYSKADIANYHYPGINGPKATDTMQRPTLFGEYAHLPTYNRRELLTDPGIRDAYNAPLVTFYDSIYDHSKNLGGAIWSGIDDTFHLPDGKIVGYGPWGPLDGWRRKKPEYFGVKKAYSPVRINKVERLKSSLKISVENRYDFTSFSDIKIYAILDDSIQKEIKSNISPGAEGIIYVPFDIGNKTVKISFQDPSGHIAEEEFYDFSKDTSEGEPAVKKIDLGENSDAYMIHQGDVTYILNKRNGRIESVTKNGKVLLEEGPVFAISASNGEDGGKNNIAGETYQNDIHPLQTFSWYPKYADSTNFTFKNGSLLVELQITFKEGKGKISYEFTPDGKFITNYNIKSGLSDIKPYQYGLMLRVPVEFDKLAWKRKGAFTLYPKDHIGRNVGEAILNAKYVGGVEPWGIEPDHSWKDDTSLIGSNDFRSTKRNILSSVLSNKEGMQIEVLSNGKQASRSWLQEKSICWLIADYFNNGSEPFYGSPYNYGRIEISKDTELEGQLILKFN